jgi:beta-lactamase regulating signal transducer with metallopeptidase domain
MNLFLVGLEQWADMWTGQLWRASWQGAIVLAAVWAIARFATFLSPRVICWMWRLACIKLLVALVWIGPVNLPVLPAPSRAILPAPDSVRPSLALAQAQSPQPLPGAGQIAALAAASASSNARVVLACLWLGGVLCSLALATRQWNAARRWAALSMRPRGGSLRSICLVQARRLRVKALPRLRIARALSGPAVVGILRPTILFPRGAERSFSPAELSFMAGHELAHVKRHDLAWNCLLLLARSLFFFHPLVWVMSRGWSSAQESACDELVLAAGEARAPEYGRMLLKLARLPGVRARPSLATAGVFGTYEDLERRILTMSRFKLADRRQLIVAAALIVVAAILTLVPWRLVAQEEKATIALVAVAADDEEGDADKAAREELDRRKSTNNVRQIMLAMHNYAAEGKGFKFPPAYTSKEGKALLSWRVAILPYLDQKALYDDFHLDEPWDSAHNKKLLTKMPAVYRSPASKHEGSRTVYLTPRGDATAFPGATQVGLPQITDGTSNTIAILEVDDDRAVPWTAPGDWKFDPDHPKAGLGHLYKDGFNTGFCDGSAHFIPNTIDDNMLKAMFTIGGREIVMLP